MPDFARQSRFVLLLVLFSSVALTEAHPQNCPTVPDKSGLYAFVHHYRQEGTNDEKLKLWMKSETAERLDAATQSIFAMMERRSSSFCFVRWRPDENTVIEIDDDKTCSLVRQALSCHQALGWPLSRNPRASTATATKKDVSGKDILAAELSDQKRNSAKEDAFDQIDAEAERLGCDKVGSSKSTACDDLNIQRQNLINDERQMKGTSTDTATQRKLPDAIKPAESKASPSKITSIDADGGLSASQCVDASLSKPAYFRSGDKRECPAIINGGCHNYKVTLTMTNRCKRTVSSEVEWGGKTGYITASGGSSGTTECQASSGAAGSSKTTCSPGTLIDPKFSK